MKMRRVKLALAVFAALGWSSTAFAGTATFELHRATLINVTDTAGTTQHEVGQIYEGTTSVGYYQISRRFDQGGASAVFNAAATQIVLLFAPAIASDAPENITIDGTHSFTSGNFKGSVSAFSKKYAFTKAADVTYTIPSAGVESVKMVWAGHNVSTVP